MAIGHSLLTSDLQSNKIFIGVWIWVISSTSLFKFFIFLKHFSIHASYNTVDKLKEDKRKCVNSQKGTCSII